VNSAIWVVKYDSRKEDFWANKIACNEGDAAAVDLYREG